MARLVFRRHDKNTVVFTMQHYQRKLHGFGFRLMRIFGLQGDALFLEREADSVGQAEVVEDRARCDGSFKTVFPRNGAPVTKLA